MGNPGSSSEFAVVNERVPAHGAESRAAPRYTLLIRAAKLVTRRGEYLCVIRDASETGISARTFHRLPEGGAMAVELQNGDRYAVDLVWQEVDRAGFRFASAVDISRIIECPSQFAKRSVRINLTAPAQIELHGRAEYATIRDISQQGAKVACASTFAIDQRVRLHAEGMRPTFAKIRWRRGGACGLVFEETYNYGELARTVCLLQGAF